MSSVCKRREVSRWWVGLKKSREMEKNEGKDKEARRRHKQ